MAYPTSVRLLEVEPDLARYLSPEQRSAARSVRLPVRSLSVGEVNIPALLRDTASYAAIVLDGMVVETTQLDDHTGVRLLSPGDFLAGDQLGHSLLISDTSCRVVVAARLALFGRDFLVAVHQWPGLSAGIQVRQAEQADRLLAQLLICQLPRVEDRIRSMMWLLAESWGQVTPTGTVLPLTLTHSLLGGLVGARRSTVTLALQQLAKDCHLIRQEHGWLLLSAPPEPAHTPDRFGLPSLYPLRDRSALDDLVNDSARAPAPHRLRRTRSGNARRCATPWSGCVRSTSSASSRSATTSSGPRPSARSGRRSGSGSPDRRLSR